MKKGWKIALASLFLTQLASAQAAERVVSIGGDVTEIVYALGAGSELVARDSTSTHPSQATQLPDVGYMRMLNAEGILSTKPTLVLTSDLAQPSLALQQVAESHVKVVRVPGNPTLDTVIQKIEVVADALNRRPEGDKLIAEFRSQLKAVKGSPLHVKVLLIMSHGGMGSMAAGQNTAADSIITTAGAQNAMQGFSRYRPLSQEGIVAAAPDLLLLTTDGVKTLGGLDNVWKLPGLAMTPAGRNKRALVVDDMALLGFGLETPAVLAKLRLAAEQAK
jgi:iron complex transport system substrate-binding protein